MLIAAHNRGQLRDTTVKTTQRKSWADKSRDDQDDASNLYRGTSDNYLSGGE